MRLLSRLLGRSTAPPQRAFQTLEADSPAVGPDGLLAERIGIAIYGGGVGSLLEQGSEVPIERSYTFSTTEDNQDQITLRLYRGNASVIAENKFLGEIRLSGFPLARAREPRVRLFVRVTGRNLELAAANDFNGEQVRLTRIRSSDLDVLQ